VDVDVDVDVDEQAIILTEGQIHTGLKAAEFVEKCSRNHQKKNSAKHPFVGMEGMSYLLYRITNDDSKDNLPHHAIIAGHDTVLPVGAGGIEFRVLMLLDEEEDNSGDMTMETSAFWAKLSSDASSIHRLDSKQSYKLEPQEFHPSSSAYKACETVLAYIRSNVKIVPFLEPVDPIALNIPDYFDVVKNPMDISTMEKKLANGKYGRLPPDGEYSSPTSKMLHGPFYDDLMQIFDNAMLYNPKGDWIHNDASSLKGLASRKVENITLKAERDHNGFASSGGRGRTKKQSIYVDEDSDIDLYEYESDYDDEMGGREVSRRGKRKRGGSKSGRVEDFATRAIESPVSFSAHLVSSMLSKLSITVDANLFGLPQEWSCRHKNGGNGDVGKHDISVQREEKEMEELMMLQIQLEQQQQVRRSARSHVVTAISENGTSSGGNNINKALEKVEYFIQDDTLAQVVGDISNSSVKNRVDVESVRETLHEEVYAKLYYKYCSKSATNPLFVQSSHENGFGIYTEGSFPPYLGRIVPKNEQGSCHTSLMLNDAAWEIRSEYALPALRWVLRGLVESGHFVEWEPSSLENIELEAAVMTNHVYYQNDSSTPFEVLDVKEMQRRKRSGGIASKEEVEEEEVELSAYEKMRAERVERNKERLKLLGLA